MMTQLEAGKLITAARQFDRYLPPADDISTMLWMERFNLEHIDYADAYKVVVTSAVGTITIQTIIDAVRHATRRTPERIAEDVRSARARGLVPREWSEKDALPADIQAPLLELRNEARTTAVALNPVNA